MKQMTERRIGWLIIGILIAWPTIALALWSLLSKPLQQFMAITIVMVVAALVLVWLGGLEHS